MDHGRIVSSNVIACAIRPMDQIIITQYEDGCIKRWCNWGSEYCPEVKEIANSHDSKASTYCPGYPTTQNCPDE